VWALGTLAVAGRWFSSWFWVRRLLRESTAAGVTFLIPVRWSASQLEPAVVGILHPVLLLPEAMERFLAPEEMHAVLAHERCHVAWRDNLAATIHMLVEALFWFHPLVWWLGRRIVDERERACDERVLAQGHASRSYAEGILKVCEHYQQSPLASTAGVGGGHLSRRIEAIMQNNLIERLGIVRKLVLTVAACGTLGIPLASGALTSPRGSAQAARDASAPVLRNVSIQLATYPVHGQLPEGSYQSALLLEQGGAMVLLAYRSLRGLVAAAYGVDETRVVGKDLSKEPNYFITADNPWPESPTDSGEVRAARFRRSTSESSTLLRELLATHFGLVVKRERRQMEGYVLSVGAGGSKLVPDMEAPYWQQGTGRSNEELITTQAPVAAILKLLQDMFQSPVVDQTGLKGTYDYKLTWKPSSPGTTPGPDAMAKALEDQLGLHFEAKTVAVDVINVVSLNSPQEVVTKQ
jgi:bla regulator protein blaR1